MVNGKWSVNGTGTQYSFKLVPPKKGCKIKKKKEVQIEIIIKKNTKIELKTKKLKR